MKSDMKKIDSDTNKIDFDMNKIKKMFTQMMNQKNHSYPYKKDYTKSHDHTTVVSDNKKAQPLIGGRSENWWNVDSQT